MASSKDTDISSMDRDTIKKYLFQIAIKSQWDQVVTAYSLNKEAHNAKITKSGDTALHIAVSDGQDKIVEKLVRLVSDEDLKSKNELGNTPLHIAASMGNVQMCTCIAKDRSLVGALNEENETPLLLAALYGRKDAFLCLHDIWFPTLDDPQRRYDYCRRKDGETILHSAIAAGHFDLAFCIILLYTDLVNCVNTEGMTPLHLLATKPDAFRSCSDLGLRSKIIYHCIQVDELKADRRDLDDLHQWKLGKDPKYPENYQTCINFIRRFSNIVQAVTRGQKRGDEENPEATGPNNKPGYPGNYKTCFEFVKLLSKLMLIVLGLGSAEIRKMREKKEKHKWSVQIVNELLSHAPTYESEDGGMDLEFHLDRDKTTPYKIVDGGNLVLGGDDDVSGTDAIDLPSEEDQQQVHKPNYGKESITEGPSEDEQKEKKTPQAKRETPLLTKKTPQAKRETPLLTAAKNGITEMVEKVLEYFPVAIHEMNSEKKNVVLLAVENRQPHVYHFLLKSNLRDSVFSKVDHKGNSALHLAAKLGHYEPWLFPGAALQMQSEIKWYKYVKDSVPSYIFARYNSKGETADEIFTKTHTKLVKAGREWLTSNCQSYSAVSGFIITVAFATATAVPGGIKEATGRPNFENQPAFDVFAIASLLALCFSVASIAMFLSILVSRCQEKDFEKDLPRKLLAALTSLFVSMVSMLVSFCAGHFFMLKEKLKYIAFPVYAITCLPVVFLAIVHFPLYCNLVLANSRTPSAAELQSTRVAPRAYRPAAGSTRT